MSSLYFLLVIKLIQVVPYTFFELSHENGSKIESHQQVGEGDTGI